MANEDKSTRYQRLRRDAAIATAAVDGLLLAGVMVSGSSRALADRLAGVAAPVATVVFVLALLALRGACVAPVAYVTEVVHERRYGRSPLSVHNWVTSFLWRGLVLAAALVGAALVIRAAAWWSPSGWWGWASATLAAAAAGGSAVLPGLAARSASSVAPLGRAELATRLAALSQRAGADALPVHVWKAGRRGAGATAMLVGLGSSRRILVADAVLDTHSDEEVEVIVAHELAHHHRGDAWWSAVMAAMAMTLGLYAAARLLPYVSATLMLAGASDAAALPFIALVFGVVVRALAPLANALSRAQERRADRDALRWTGNAPALVRALKRLSSAQLAEDRPPLLAEVFFHRHPAVAERIAAAERWSASNSQFTIHNSQTQ